MKMKLSDRKISVYEDDLKNIYRMADNIAALKAGKDDDPAYLLGLAQGMAETIQTTIEIATHGKVGKKKAGGNGNGLE